jgi:putative transposase
MANRAVDDDDVVRNAMAAIGSEGLVTLLSEMLHLLMDGEVQTLCGAGYGERAEGRTNRRNGYRERPFETRLGSVELRIPKLREGSYMPSFLEPRRRWEKAFVNVVCEAYVHGVSTRKVEELVESMGAKGMSKSEVSRMAQALDAQVEAFRARPLGDRATPYLWLDALYQKVRDERGRTISKAILVAYGVDESGDRQVIDLEVAAGEMATAWGAFLQRLLARGLRGVQLVISDAHYGLRQAVREVLVGVAWQRCTIHFRRNVLSVVPRKLQDFVMAPIKAIFAQPTLDDAREATRRALEVLDKHCPAAAALLREAEDDILTFMTFPKSHWRQIHSTNPLERINKEIRRRTRVVGIFPNDASILRLVGMLLIEQNDEWAVGRRYFSLASMAQLDAGDAPRALVDNGETDLAAK